MSNDSREGLAVGLDHPMEAGVLLLLQEMTEFCANQNIASLGAPWSDREVEIEGTSYLASPPICPEKIFGADVEVLVCYVILNSTEVSYTKIVTDTLYLCKFCREAMFEVVMRGIAEEKWFDVALSQVNVFAWSRFLYSTLFIAAVSRQAPFQLVGIVLSLPH